MFRGSMILILHLLVNLTFIIFDNHPNWIDQRIMFYLRAVNQALSKVTFPCVLSVTTGYWGFLGRGPDVVFSFINLQEHMFNSIIACISFVLMNRIYYVWWHVIGRGRQENHQNLFSFHYSRFDVISCSYQRNLNSEITLICIPTRD